MNNPSKDHRLNPLKGRDMTLAALPMSTAPKPKFKRLLATAITLALGINLPAAAADFAVTVGSDDGTAGTANTLSWAILQANTAAGADTITIETDVTITGVMKSLMNSDITLQNDGFARSISGDNQFRPLFIKSGQVTIQNLTLKNGKAKGGGSKGGGGGAGLGGALFIYDGTVSVDNVTFENNNATGGSISGAQDHYGGGGMFGNGGGVVAGDYLLLRVPVIMVLMVEMVSMAAVAAASAATAASAVAVASAMTSVASAALAVVALVDSMLARAVAKTMAALVAAVTMAALAAVTMAALAAAAWVAGVQSLLKAAQQHSIM